VQLYLLRHGDAVTNAFDDASRTLSPLGEEQVRCMARLLKKLNVRFDGILCSPLTRAQQTACIAMDTLGGNDVTITEHLLPTSDHRQIFNQLNGQSWESVLLVGHEPHLSTLISLLVSDSRNARVEMKTSGLALCTASSPVEKGNGVLRWIVNSDLANLLML
jgi:phosphohistidine phosphatase